MSLRQAIRDLYEELRDPDLIVASYLSSQEEVYYDDPPAIQAFLFLNWWEIGLVAGLLVADVFSLLAGQRDLFLIIFVLVDVLVVFLVVQRFQQLFTRYVITSSRLMRISGVVSRQSQSIPWAKVTDLSFKQTVWMRYFGFANVRIESANEATTGLQELRGLKNPLQFNRLMLEMVAAKQGHTTPESGDSPLAKFESDSPLRRRARHMSNQPKPPPPPAPPRWSGPRRSRPPWRRRVEIGRGGRRPSAIDDGGGGATMLDDGGDDDSVLFD